VTIPATTATDTTPFTLQMGRDLLAGLQAQDQPVRVFQEVLQATSGIADTVEVGTVQSALSQDPTSSSLFQAHSGALSASQAGAGPAESTPPVDQLALFKVAGVDASSATGPFANGQSSASDDFQVAWGGIEAAASRYPSVSGVGDAAGTYDPQRGAGRMNPPIGIRVDLKG